MAFNLRD